MGSWAEICSTLVPGRFCWFHLFVPGKFLVIIWRSFAFVLVIFLVARKLLICSIQSWDKSGQNTWTTDHGCQSHSVKCIRIGLAVANATVPRPSICVCSHTSMHPLTLLSDMPCRFTLPEVQFFSQSDSVLPLFGQTPKGSVMFILQCRYSVIPLVFWDGYSGSLMGTFAGLARWLCVMNATFLPVAIHPDPKDLPRSPSDSLGASTARLSEFKETDAEVSCQD